jgi:hypothetical protein
MSARYRWLAVPGVALLFTIIATLSPYVFRRMDSFRVRQIEVSGTRYMAPEAALAASGITDSSSVFDDFDAWAARLRSERMIEDARLMRRLPGTLRIEVVEAEPVALIRTPELRAVDATGRLLPMRLAGADLDVPLVTGRAKVGADSVADRTTNRLIAAFLYIREFDEGLANRVSEIARAAGGGVKLTLRAPAAAELLLPDPPEERSLREVLIAMDHLRSETETGLALTALDRLARMEARYPDELFVMLRPARKD